MTAPLRLAQVHLMRTAGTFVSAYLSDALSPTHRVHISWFEHLKRDWTREEMLAFADTDGPVFVHNHVVSWDATLLKQFQDAGFFVFAFVRNVGDQLCSLYHFAKERCPEARQIGVDDFLMKQIFGQICCDMSERDWIIPEYWRELDWISVFTPERFQQFLKNQLSLTWNANSPWSRPNNSSANPGFQRLCERGEISPATQECLRNSLAQQRFLEVQARTSPLFAKEKE